MPGKEDLTPWCTCFGSLVCSYYADKFKNDGTSIKFINEPGSNPPEGAFNIPTNMNCEAKAREYFDVQAHGTPGVTDPNGYATKCPDYDVAANIKPLSSIAVGVPHRPPPSGTHRPPLPVIPSSRHSLLPVTLSFPSPSSSPRLVRRLPNPFVPGLTSLSAMNSADEPDCTHCMVRMPDRRALWKAHRNQSSGCSCTAFD